MIEVLVDDGVGAVEPADVEELTRQLSRMVAAAGLSEGGERELELSVRLCGDAAIHQLNRDFRGKDAPTDVLSFSQREGASGDLHPELLGDIAISVDTAARQAADAGRSLLAELLFLAAHGLCHLLGYDHQTDDQEAEMNARAAALLAEGARTGDVSAA